MKLRVLPPIYLQHSDSFVSMPTEATSPLSFLHNASDLVDFLVAAKLI